jgi:hypothetical protein
MREWGCRTAHNISLSDEGSVVLLMSEYDRYVHSNRYIVTSECHTFKVEILCIDEAADSDWPESQSSTVPDLR